MKANPDRSVRKEIDEFDVAAIGLDGGADEFDDPLDAGTHVFGMCGGGRHVVAMVGVDPARGAVFCADAPVVDDACADPGHAGGD